jgi:hypothetical protein
MPEIFEKKSVYSLKYRFSDGKKGEIWENISFIFPTI